MENHHRQVPFHLLKEVPELSDGDSGSGNASTSLITGLLVEGDNLLALNALLPYYAGEVHPVRDQSLNGIKCIYIDQPYNTGNENWIYNDTVNSFLPNSPFFP